MLTGDLNSAQVEWSVQYDVSDARAYLFHLRSPEETLRDFSESVMREAVGDRTVDECSPMAGRAWRTTPRRSSSRPWRSWAWVCGSSGATQPGAPSGAVQRSFDEVSRAQQEQQQLINVAEGEYNKVVPRASGEACRRSRGGGLRPQAVNEARATWPLQGALELYDKAPEITRQRIYWNHERGDSEPGQQDHLDDAARQFLPLMHLQQLQYSQPGITRPQTQTQTRGRDLSRQFDPMKSFLSPLSDSSCCCSPPGGFYTVGEGEQVIITRFGQPVGRPSTPTGKATKPACTSRSVRGGCEIA